MLFQRRPLWSLRQVCSYLRLCSARGAHFTPQHPSFFPTEVRATGTGVMGAAARAGGIVAAQLGGTLLLVSFPLALSIFALSLVVAGIAALSLRGGQRAEVLSERLGEGVTARST